MLLHHGHTKALLLAVRVGVTPAVRLLLILLLVALADVAAPLVAKIIAGTLLIFTFLLANVQRHISELLH